MQRLAQTQLGRAGFAKRVGLTWAAIAFVVLLVNLAGIATRRFPDPDDIMRLLQVRDLLGGQAWFDTHQYRVDAADGGVLMHWSRFVDIPLTLAIAALTPIVGSADAEIGALAIGPLLTLGIAMALACRIVWRVLGDEAIVMTCVAMVLSVPLLFQFTPMRIDHHGWQIVGGLIAVNGIMARKAWQGGLVTGLAMAVWLSISLEGLPLAAAICALMAWRWWKDSKQRGWLAWTMAGLAAGSVLAFALTRGAGDFQTFCDAIGPVHIAMFVWGALVLGVLARVNPVSRWAILSGFCVAGMGAMALLLGTAPECAGSNFSRLDPVLIDFWYQRVGEGLPIWRQPMGAALQIIVFPLLGIYASWRLSKRGEAAQRAFWREYSLLLIAAILVSMLVARAGAMAAALAAVPMGWQIHQWLMQIRVIKKPSLRVVAMLAIIAALAPNLPLIIWEKVVPVHHAQGQAEQAVLGFDTKVSSCNIAESAKLMAGLPKGEIYAPLDVAPRLLLETHHSVIATGHHRGEKGMVFVIETALGSSEDAGKVLQDRGTQYVAICPDLSEIGLYAYARPDGFAADLIGGNAPDWLEPIAFESKSGLKAWRIVSD